MLAVMQHPNTTASPHRVHEGAKRDLKLMQRVPAPSRLQQAFERMQQQGFRPDACVYNAVLDALVGSGLVAGQAKAAQLAAAAHRQGHLRLTALSPHEATASAYSCGAAFMVVLRWLGELRWASAPWGRDRGRARWRVAACSERSCLRAGPAPAGVCVCVWGGGGVRWRRWGLGLCVCARWGGWREGDAECGCMLR